MPAPYVLAIDPGHGGSATSDPAVLWDPGVVAGSLMEKDITLDLALRLKALLEKERVRVVLTRSADRYLEISDRWNLVHVSGARLFVSLHVNAFEGDPSIDGFTVFYPRADSQPLSQQIEAGLAASLKPFGIPDDGVAPKPELWIHSDIPTATIEPAYLTNPREKALLGRNDFRDAVAAGVYQGLLAADPQISATAEQIRQVEAAQAAHRRAEAAAAAAGASGQFRGWEVAGVAVGAVGLGVLARRWRHRPARAVNRSRSHGRRRRHAPAASRRRPPVRDRVKK